MKHRDEILKLRAEGKTYDEIRKITGASKGTISFHCGKGQKEKYNQRLTKRRKLQHPYEKKLESFIYNNKKYKVKLNSKSHLMMLDRIIYKKIHNFSHNKLTGEYIMLFTTQDIINKFGENPKCYLTGKSIDIYKPKTYNFDHIIPTSKGGTNTLDNLGICTKEANMSKTDHTLEDFIQLCKEILENQGYKVTK